ncbi:hypothetical protein DV515_00006679, partial [Chloebia gouldiae]
DSHQETGSRFQTQIPRALLIPTTAPCPPPSSILYPLYSHSPTHDTKGGTQVHQETNKNKLVPFGVMNYLFLHSLFCLLFPKAKHPDQVGVRGKMSSFPPGPGPYPQEQILCATHGGGHRDTHPAASREPEISPSHRTLAPQLGMRRELYSMKHDPREPQVPGQTRPTKQLGPTQQC